MLIHGMVVQGRADNKHYGAAALLAPDEEALKNYSKLTRIAAELVLKL